MRNITSSHPHKTRLARRYHLDSGGLLAATLGGILMGPLILASHGAPQKPDRERHAPFAPDSQSIRPYADWASREVAYVITEEEKVQFAKLKTEGEREAFIREFWERRNPEPGSDENKFKKEYYRRLAYAKQHFSYFIPGRIDDRARIYIEFGPPDEIKVLAVGPDKTPSHARESKGLEQPVERWTYRSIASVGTNITVEFTDPSGTGDRKVVVDPISLIDHTPSVGTQGLTSVSR